MNLASNRLIAGRRQYESICPSVGASVTARELIIDRKDGSRIGTREMDDAIDNRVWLSLIHHMNRYGEGRASRRCGRENEIHGCVPRSATADGHQNSDGEQERTN